MKKKKNRGLRPNPLLISERRKIRAMRRALIRLLWVAVADQAGCVCEDGEPLPTSTCEAWRVLGYGVHFDWRVAQQRLPATRGLA